MTMNVKIPPIIDFSPSQRKDSLCLIPSHLTSSLAEIIFLDVNLFTKFTLYCATVLGVFPRRLSNGGIFNKLLFKSNRLLFSSCSQEIIVRGTTF